MDENREISEQIEQLEEETERAGGRKKLAEVFGVQDIKLTKPVEWCGEIYAELHLNFEGLKGRDMEAIDDEIGILNLRGLTPAYSRRYQRLLAARAAGVPSDMIEQLPLPDYNAVVTAAQNFLFVTG